MARRLTTPFEAIGSGDYKALSETLQQQLSEALQAKNDAHSKLRACERRCDHLASELEVVECLVPNTLTRALTHSHTHPTLPRMPSHVSSQLPGSSARA